MAHPEAQKSSTEAQGQHARSEEDPSRGRSHIARSTGPVVYHEVDPPQLIVNLTSATRNSRELSTVLRSAATFFGRQRGQQPRILPIVMAGCLMRVLTEVMRVSLVSMLGENTTHLGSPDLVVYTTCASSTFLSSWPGRGVITKTRTSFTISMHLPKRRRAFDEVPRSRAEQLTTPC